MLVEVLGSAAAEGWPALFCECEACQEARRRGGKNVRHRTSYCFDRKLLVDFGPDVMAQALRFGIDFSGISDILITHSHEDHLTPFEFYWRRKGFSVVSRGLTVYGNRQVLDRVRNESRMAEHDLKLDLVEIRPGDVVSVGPFTVTALKAFHGNPGEDALNFVIARGAAAVLIANDTGWWEEPTWQAIRAHRIDGAFIDCTYGLANPDNRAYHMGAGVVVEMRKRLQELGVLKPDARVFANHFSHNGKGLHEELCEWFAPHGIEVGWDGLKVEFAE